MATSVEEILKKCYSYLYTVNSLLCFISLTCWGRDPVPNYAFGRRMSTSGGNKIRKNGEVTPDAVIQIAEELGLIIEIKSSLPENDEYWKKEAAQLLKYDDDLDGWWTPDERIAAYNVILLIDQARSLEFKAYLSKLRDLGESSSAKASAAFLLLRYRGFPSRYNLSRDGAH